MRHSLQANYLPDDWLLYELHIEMLAEDRTEAAITIPSPPPTSGQRNSHSSEPTESIEAVDD